MILKLGNCCSAGKKKTHEKNRCSDFSRLHSNPSMHEKQPTQMCNRQSSCAGGGREAERSGFGRRNPAEGSGSPSGEGGELQRLWAGRISGGFLQTMELSVSARRADALLSVQGGVRRGGPARPGPKHTRGNRLISFPRLLTHTQLLSAEPLSQRR